MARNFVAASSQALTRTTVPVSAAPFTIAAWNRPTTLPAGAKTVVSLGSSSTQHYFDLYYAAGTSNKPKIEQFDGTTTGTALHGSTIATGAWSHICGVVASNSSRSIYVNGAGKVTDTTVCVTPTSLDRFDVGRLTFNGAAQDFQDGDIAEVAVWNIALSDADVAALALGLSPMMVHPEALVFYSKLDGRSPEIDLFGRRDLTLVNAPVQATSHPRIFLPSTRATTPKLILPPTITSVVPSSDRTTGGDTITLLGTNFDAAVTVTVGGNPGTSVTRVSATKVTFIAPAGSAGATTVVATNPGALTGSHAFTYYAVNANPNKLMADFGGSTPKIDYGSVKVNQDSSKGTASFTIVPAGTRPVPYTPIKFGLGSLADRDLIFRGEEQDTDTVYAAETNVGWNGVVTDSGAQFNRHVPFGTYTNQPADVVALDLLSKFAPDFTGAHIASGLPNVTVAYAGTTTLDAAFQGLAKLIGGGYWRDESYDVHLFQTETPTTVPDAIDGSNTSLSIGTFKWKASTSQSRNRAVCIGGSTQTIRDAAIGDTMLVVDAPTLFDNSPNTVLIADGQRVTYTTSGFAYTPHFDAWTTRSTTSLIWGSILWVSELSLFVVAGSTNFLTSPDGITFTSQTIPVSGAWNALAWSPSLHLLVAVDGTFAAGRVMTSPDGVTWTSRTPAATSEWQDVAWSPSLGLFAAVAFNGGTSGVMTSPDGINWTSRTTPNGVWLSITWAASLGLFVAVGNFSTTCVMTSPDGITWTARSESVVNTSVAWSPTLNLFAAVSQGNVSTSSNGTAWTDHAGALNNNNWQKVIWSPELALFIAVARTAASGNATATSPDGLVWTTYPASALGNWYGVAWSPTQGITVAVGQTGGSATAFIMSSSSDILTALGGIPASGAGSITAAILTGTSVSLYAVRDDAVAQAAVAAIEGGTSDGVYEFTLSDPSKVTQTSLNALGDADLSQHSPSTGIITASGTSYDKKIHYGKPIHINKNGLVADLLIQTVSITDIDSNTGPPKFAWTASSIRFSLEELIRKLSQATL